MRRKITSQKNGGHTIYLPAQWVQRNKFQSRGEVNLEAKGNKIIVSAVEGSEDKVTSIVLTTNNQLKMRSIISSVYKSGADEIIVTFECEPKLEILNKVIHSFTGLEIVSQHKRVFIIKSFLTLNEKEIEKLILKLFQTVHYVANKIGKEWIKVDFDDIQLMVDINIMKLRDMSLRGINKTQFGEDKSYDYYVLVTALTLIATEFRDLTEYIVKYKSKKSVLITESISLFNDLYKTYLSFTKNDSVKVWLQHNRRKVQMLSAGSVYKNKDPLYVFYYTLMRRFQAVSSRILSLSY